MARWTQEQVDNLRKAVGSGAAEVRYSDGAGVRYISLSEAMALLTMMEESLANGGRPPSRISLATFTRD